MTSISVDLTDEDELRHRNLCRGDVYVFSPTTPTLAIVGHARFLIEEAFGANPTSAQYGMTPEQFWATGGPLKQRFIHHPEITRKLFKRVVAARGSDSTPPPAELIAEDCSGDAEGGALVFTAELHEQATTPASVQ